VLDLVLQLGPCRAAAGVGSIVRSRRVGATSVSTLIIALWPQVNPTVALGLTCVAWGCVPAFVIRIIPP
jgi:hypothetical protein